MLELPLGKFVTAYQHLAAFCQTAKSTIQAEKGIALPDNDYRELLKTANDLVQLCGAIGMQVSLGAARRVCDELQSALNDKDLWILKGGNLLRCHNALNQLIGCLRHEADTKVAIMIEGNSVSLYEQRSPIFGSDVAAKFPSIVYEIEEAGKCIALGRSTAATFHSIRCLEAGFAAIWRCLGVADPLSGFERNWSNRLQKVQAEVEKRWPKKSGRMTGDAKFFDSIIGSFVGMQNPYRNNTMHFDAKYTEEEAKHIFELVKGIMQRVASRMDESGQPLA